MGRGGARALKVAALTPRGYRRGLVALLAAGAVARLILALFADTEAFDAQSFEIVRHNLVEHGFAIYQYVNVGNWRWPYPPGYFPWIGVSGVLAGDSAQLFHLIVRVPSIAADVALAWVVQEFLRTRGAAERTRLAAAGLVALGPVFLAISGYHGQIDSVAILPAAIALVVWERMGGERRALVAGALIGAGGAIKTVPLLMVLALAPSARSWREAGLLVAAAAAVPLALIAPFMLATGGGPELALRRYHGHPGQGMLTLAAQPELVSTWLLGAEARPARYSELTLLIVRHATEWTIVILAAVAAVAGRYRPAPARVGTLLWLAILALGPAFFFQYLIWGLPFFLMAGYVRAAASIQVAVAVPMVLFYLAPWEEGAPVYVYALLMLAVWVGTLAALAAVTRGVISRRPPADLAAPRHRRHRGKSPPAHRRGPATE